MKLNHLTDKALLLDMQALVSKERKLSTEILYHLKEIERRRLFSVLGYGSLFEYAVKELKYTEGAATRRIQAARLLASMPEIRPKIEAGVLSLSNLAQTAMLFKKEDIKDPSVKKEIIRQIESKTSRECGQVLFGFTAAPEIPSEGLRPVAKDTYSLRINLSEATVVKLEEYKNIMSNKNLSYDELVSSLLDLALTSFKKRIERTATPAPGSQCSRYVPLHLKNEIYRRDGGKCSRCGSKFKLQYDHIIPFALGGKSSAANLRLLCMSCNQRRRMEARL